MNGECRVRVSERPPDGLFERSESRRVVNENRLHDRRERPHPEELSLPIVDLRFRIYDLKNQGILGLKDSVIGD